MDAGEEKKERERERSTQGTRAAILVLLRREGDYGDGGVCR